MLIVVTGMHRSGTSAIAEMLSGLGADLGPIDLLMGATHSNPHGHFESLPIVAMNERLLGEVGAHWLHPVVDPDDIERMAGGPYAQLARNALAEAGYSATAQRPFAVKDPRFCLTLPFWWKVLERDGHDARLVAIYRSQSEVGQSLRQRDGLDSEYGSYLWQSYNRSLLARSYANQALFTSFDRLLDSPASVAEALRNFVPGLLENESPEASVDENLRHHVDDRRPSEPVWNALEALAEGREPSSIPGQSETPPNLSVIGHLAAALGEIRLERDEVREIRRSQERASAVQVRRLQREQRRIVAELHDVSRRLGDYEHSRAAGLARLSWRIKAKLRSPNTEPRATESCVAPPRPVSFKTTGSPAVSVVVHGHTVGQLLDRSLRSLAEEATGISAEVFVVREAPDRPDEAWLSDSQGVQILGADSGPTKWLPRSVASSRGRWLLLIRSGVILEPGCLPELLDTAVSSGSPMIVVPKLLNADGRIAEAGRVARSDGAIAAVGVNQLVTDPLYLSTRPTDSGSIDCLLLDRRGVEELGGAAAGLDPQTAIDDLALRGASSGRTTRYQPSAEASSLGGVDRPTQSAAARQHLLDQHTAAFRECHDPTEIDSVVVGPRGQPHVLIVDHEIPTPDRDSGSVRMSTMLEIFRSLGCRVTFVPANGQRREPYVSEMRQSGIEVYCGGQSLKEAMQRVSPAVDVVVGSRPQVAAVAEPLARRMFPNAAFVYDMVDFHGLRENRQSAVLSEVNGGGAEVLELETRLAGKSDLVLAISEPEAEMIRSRSPTHVAVMPNIHRANQRTVPFERRSGVLFVGSWSHPPNSDGVEWLCDQVVPRVAAKAPHVIFHLVGSNMPARGPWDSLDNVIAHGWLPSLDELADSTRVNIAPLRFGAGLKGKVGDALARGIPTVSTTIGAEGFGPVQNVLEITDDPSEFADAILRLHESPEEWSKRSLLGMELIEAHFGVHAATKVARELLERLVE